MAETERIDPPISGDHDQPRAWKGRMLGRNRTRPEAENNPEKGNAEAEYKSLFPSGKNGRYEGECIEADLKPDGTVDLAIRTISRSDARIYGHGKMLPAPKKNERMPDFRGFLVDPQDEDAPPPTQYDVAGWWKTIQNGDQAGEKYLQLALTPSNETKPKASETQTKVSEAQPKASVLKPAKTNAPMTTPEGKSTDPLNALLVEVFELTGQKVTRDDPILVAALIQSSLVKRAGDDAANSLQDAVVKAVAELAEAVKVERQQAANLDRTVANAFQQITDGAKKAGDQELTTMQTRFARMASETLDQVRREAAKQAPGGKKWKLAAIVLTGLVIGLAIGVMIGKSWSPKITNDQVRLMHNGILLDAAWAKLPKAARELVEAAGKPIGAASGEDKAGKDKRP